MQSKRSIHRAAASRRGETIIRFVDPHIARIESDDGQFLRRLESDKCSGLGLRLQLAVKQGRIRVEEGQVLVDGGLAESVAAGVAATGRNVRVIQSLWWTSRRRKPPEYWSKLQESFAATLVGRGRSLAECPDFDDRVALLQAIGGLYPRKSISVAVDNCAEANKVASRLYGTVPQKVYQGMACSRTATPEMNIMASRGFALGSFRQIAVAFGTHTVLNQRFREIVRPYPNCLRIGLLDTRIDLLRPADRTALEAFFGPRRIDAEDHGLLLPVHAAVLPAPAYPASPRRFRNALTRKQKMIWKNDKRNLRLATLAKQLQRQDGRGLKVSGINDPTDIIPRPADAGKLRVAVVVESSAHGRELQSHLPGWEIVASGTDRETFGIEADGHIVTLRAAQAVGLTTEAVVYAAGTGSRWIGACGGRGWHEGSLQLVVDVADDFDEQARADVNARVDDYRSRGWRLHVAGQGEVFTELCRRATDRAPRRNRRRDVDRGRAASDVGRI